jgi:sigma-B regulation protein RsbU (phosphoserine phosphatase)
VLSLVLAVAGGAWEIVRVNQSRRELQGVLVNQMVERLDSDLQQIARVPQIMAATLEKRTDRTAPQLEEWMRQMLGPDQRLYGTTVAFEPHRFDPAEEDFAPYAYRPLGRPPEVIQLLPPDYVYREKPWYTAPKSQRREQWSEPYFDEYGGDILMVTYSVPILRGDEFVGVATADLSLKYFEVLRQWLDEANVSGTCFVLSKTGRVISHRDADYVKLTIDELKERHTDPGFIKMAERVTREDSETGRLEGHLDGKACVFQYARVRSTGWYLVAAIFKQGDGGSGSGEKFATRGKQ